MRRVFFPILVMIGISFVMSGSVSAQAPQTIDMNNDVTVLINQSHPLEPQDYRPLDLITPDVALASASNDREMQLSRPAALALESLFAGAKTDNIQLMLSSGYRSYTYQSSLYANFIGRYGLAAKSEVALPGASEHQSGLAADIIDSSHFCAAQGCFITTRAANWLAANSYKYGFIVRYPLGKESITGYQYEPWHFRYVGIPLAKNLHQHNQTLEEYYVTLSACAPGAAH